MSDYKAVEKWENPKDPNEILVNYDKKVIKNILKEEEGQLPNEEGTYMKLKQIGMLELITTMYFEEMM